MFQLSASTVVGGDFGYSCSFAGLGFLRLMTPRRLVEDLLNAWVSRLDWPVLDATFSSQGFAFLQINMEVLRAQGRSRSRRGCGPEDLPSGSLQQQAGNRSQAFPTRASST